MQIVIIKSYVQLGGGVELIDLPLKLVVVDSNSKPLHSLASHYTTGVCVCVVCLPAMECRFSISLSTPFRLLRKCQAVGNFIITN